MGLGPQPPATPILTPGDTTALLSTRAAIWALLSDHEHALTTLVGKLRPFASSHLEALHAQRAHYTALLDAERTANLELRIEIARSQEGLGRALSHARRALNAQNEQSGPWKRKMAALKAENRVLRGVCGLPELEVESEDGDSSSGDEEEEAGEERLRVQVGMLSGNGRRAGQGGGLVIGGEVK
jgi:hypothetical protein